MMEEFSYESGGYIEPVRAFDPVTIGNDVIPVIADVPSAPADGPFTGLQNWLGSVGSVREAARDLGTAVGTVQRDLKAAQGEYTTARTNAKAGDGLAQWWQFASPMDKAMLGIAAAGLALMVWQISKGK